jgi:hypothetical protein
MLRYWKKHIGDEKFRAIGLTNELWMDAKQNDPNVIRAVATYCGSRKNDRDQSVREIDMTQKT